MKKLTFTLNATWLSAILLSTLSVQGMESNSSLIKWTGNQLSHLWTSNTELAAQAEQYNANNCALTSLPNEILTYVFSYYFDKNENQVISLKNSIKEFMQLSTSCKKFNTLLSYDKIGTLCKNYTKHDKNWALGDRRYNNFLPRLILVCAGADATMEIRMAAMNNDEQRLATLLKHGTNINTRDTYSPLQNAKTAKIAQMLIDHNFDLAQRDQDGNNMLWHTIENDGHPVELTEFYLQHDVNPRQLDRYYGNCLLHALAKHHQYRRIDVDGALDKGKLLLDVIPDMINALNKRGETPLDIALRYNEEAIFELFRDNGGLTAQELKQKAASIKQKRNDDESRSDCIIS